MFRYLPLYFLPALLLISSCGGGSSSQSGDSQQDSPPDYQTTLKPCTIRLGEECIITIRTPMPHPQYEATLVFGDDVFNGNGISYRTSSLSYLASIGNPNQVTIHVPDMTISNGSLENRRHSLRVNISLTSKTQGTGTWETREGPDNPAEWKTKSGSGAVTISEL